MGEKDITTKTLADYNDVFADIVNVLLFQGKEVISQNELEGTRELSQYRADGKVHELERDVSKVVKHDGVTISILGMEHESRIEKYMPVRVVSYDGQSYRAQLLQKNSGRVYPVVTMVLYFGMEHWNASRHLSELVDTTEEFLPFVSDYEMKNLFEIAYLTPEQVRMFRSDFRYVADYFVQKRTKKSYHPEPAIIKHVDETLKLMSVLTGDHRFEDAANAINTGAAMQEGKNMEKFLDQIENKGLEKGIKQGIDQGIRIGETGGYEKAVRKYIKSCREKHVPDAEIKADVMGVFGISGSEADKLM